MARAKTFLKNLAFDLFKIISYWEISEIGYNRPGAFTSRELITNLRKDGMKGRLRIEYAYTRYSEVLNPAIEKEFVYKITGEDIIHNCQQNCYPSGVRGSRGWVIRCFDSKKKCDEYSPRFRKELDLTKSLGGRISSKRGKPVYIPNILRKIDFPTDNIKEMISFLDEEDKRKNKNQELIKDINCKFSVISAHVAEKSADMLLSLYEKD